MNRSTWRRGKGLAVALAMTMIPLAAGRAAEVTDQAPQPCREEGTWQGVADNGFTWMNIITRDVDATRGQMDLAWVTVDPTLGGTFANATRVTPARGVWKKVDRRNALWTWMAYGLDASGTPAYVIRASGTHQMPDCGRLDIVYALEIFLPSQDMATVPPIAVVRGTARETRMPLVQPPSGS